MGYDVRRSRQRANIPNIDNSGQFMLVDAERNCIVLGERFNATLDDIEDHLTGQRQQLHTARRESTSCGFADRGPLPTTR
jgi:hypothetical protein